MKITFLTVAAAMAVMPAIAQNKGGLSAETLSSLRSSYENSASDKAIHNAIANVGIDKVAFNVENANNISTDFKYRVPSKGITNQRSSGRCWLFTGLNVLRAQAMMEHDLPMLELSQNYNFFYDQLEKSNLFLQGMIDNASKPADDRMVDWLFSNALNDGGQFTGVADVITKYGVVPKSVMAETATSEATSKMRQLITWKLREDGLELRKMAADGKKPAEITKRKNEMLAEIYRVLALNLGVPPTEFQWTRKDKKGNVIDTKTYTPQQFYKEFFGNDLKNNYVMLMNDPTREYYKMYEIDFDRHVYDGKNWTYLNVPMEDIKKMAMASIKDSTAMYFSCDVNKFLNKDLGLLDPTNYDYASLLGVNFGMNKAERIQTHSSASSHAMTLVGVDVNEAGEPTKWLIENSWGNGANNGHLIATDRWMDEYLFRLVVERKYVPDNLRKYLNQKPVMLPAWDFMF